MGFLTTRSDNRSDNERLIRLVIIKWLENLGKNHLEVFFFTVKCESNIDNHSIKNAIVNQVNGV